MIIVTGDTNALYAMVGTIATLASIVLGYMVKSTRENTSGGIIFETAMANKMDRTQSDANGGIEEAAG